MSTFHRTTILLVAVLLCLPAWSVEDSLVVDPEGSLQFNGPSTFAETLFVDRVAPAAAGFVQVQGNVGITGNAGIGTLDVYGFDFKLGLGDQESRGDSGPSRALVKGGNATLIVNYGGDFSGGVDIHSRTKVVGNFDVDGQATVHGNLFAWGPGGTQLHVGETGGANTGNGGVLNLYTGRSGGDPAAATTFWAQVARGNQRANQPDHLVFSFFDGSAWNETLVLQPDRNITAHGDLTVDGSVTANGTLLATNIIQKPGSWSDHVFADDYELMPLAEVADFIAAERHLPGLPSEAEILEKGLDSNAMFNAHMAKIEELTLYTLQQEEALERLRSDNEELQAERDELRGRLDRIEAALKDGGLLDD